VSKIEAMFQSIETNPIGIQILLYLTIGFILVGIIHIIPNITDWIHSKFKETDL